MQHASIRLFRMAVLAGCLATVRAEAADPLGVYVGAGVGRADVRTDRIPYLGFDERDTGWTASLGVRPIPLLGAELQYFDFGHPSTTTGIYRIDAQERGPALFGVGYLPLPVPLLDLYAKAGVGRLQTTVTARSLVPIFCPVFIPYCGYAHSDTTATRFAWGTGALVKMSSLAVRAEYARFSAPNGDPDLLSLSLMWTF